MSKNANDLKKKGAGQEVAGLFCDGNRLCGLCMAHLQTVKEAVTDRATEYRP